MNMNFYTTLSNEEALTLGERLSLGLTNTLLGLLIIFLVLTILFGAVKLFAILLPKLTEKKKGSKSQESQTDKSAESIAKAPAAHPAAADNGGEKGTCAVGRHRAVGCGRRVQHCGFIRCEHYGRCAE